MDFQILKNRISAVLDDASQDVQQKQVILGKLQSVHRQVRSIIDSGSTSAGGIPWELAQGWSILGRPAAGDRLPTDPAQFTTRVMNDGTLLGCRKWELLDPGWGEALAEWMEHLLIRAHMGSAPQQITIPNQARFAIAGDWGTGDYIAAKVANAIRQTPVDYTIHLGDVYYAGVDSDENNDFSAWPAGTRGQFTLNSNHEMYNGTFGYFKELGLRFPLQENTSYFCLSNDHWLIIALDSAYYSDAMSLYMDGALGDTQIAWLRQFRGTPKKIMLLSHHQGYSIDGAATTALYDQVVGALGREPDYWYWGHLHNVICYQPRGKLLGRCVGHGAIPYGRASILDGKPQVAWAEIQSANDMAYPERVLNGFVRLVLDNDALTETFVDENGDDRWPLRSVAQGASKEAGVAAI